MDCRQSTRHAQPAIARTAHQVRGQVEPDLGAARAVVPATRHGAWLLAALLTLSSTGCVSGRWVRESADTPIPLATLSKIEVHSSTLQDVLDLLGAPLEVWEFDRTAAAVAYGWFESHLYNVKFSYKVHPGNSADINYDHAAAQMSGVVFFFDRDWILRSWRAGRLQDLLEAARRRPSLPPPS